jgi:hypothetical protein
LIEENIKITEKEKIECFKVIRKWWNKRRDKLLKNSKNNTEKETWPFGDKLIPTNEYITGNPRPF